MTVGTHIRAGDKVRDLRNHRRSGKVLFTGADLGDTRTLAWVEWQNHSRTCRDYSDLEVIGDTEEKPDGHAGSGSL